jgi:hypothetical protein
MADPATDDDYLDPELLAHMGMTEAEFRAELAAADGAQRLADETEPRAVAARYDRASGQFIINLNNGTTFIFPADLCQGLAGADPDLLAEVEITPSGAGLHWERLDNDFSIMGLMLGSFGGKTWMAKLRSEFARQAAQVKSEARVRASRENGKKGGRPRKRQA